MSIHTIRCGHHRSRRARRLRCAAATAALTVLTVGVPVSAAAAPPTFTLGALTASISDTSVTASTTIRASTTTTVTQAGVCARSSSNTNVDFPRAGSVVIRSTGTTLSGTRTLASGTYTYFACVLYAGTWRTVGAAKTFTVVERSTQIPVQNRSALAGWRRAVDARGVAPARYLAVGDSLTEGQGASTRAQRWLDRTRDNLRTRFPVAGVTGGLNYLPATYRVYGPDSTWGRPYTSTGTDPSGTSLTPTFWTPTLGYRSLLIKPEASATYAVTGTSTDIWYVGGPSTGTLAYRVDSGTTVSVPTAGPYSAAYRVPDVSLGVSGAHTIQISAASAGVYLSGFTVYNGDRDAGIQVFDSASSGATVATFLADKSGFHRSVAAASPDLITIELGANDYLGGKAPATYKAQLQELIADLETLPKVPSILLVIAYEIVPGGNPPPYAYSGYAAAMHELAAADPARVAAVDLSQLMPKTDGSGTGYYTSDALHPNDTGQRRMSDILTAVLAE